MTMKYIYCYVQLKTRIVYLQPMPDQFENFR